MREDDGILTPNLREINAQVFARLIQFLDDNSLSLIIRDSNSDDRQVLDTLTEYFIGKTKPRIINLCTELTSLAMDVTMKVKGGIYMFALIIAL